MLSKKMAINFVNSIYFKMGISIVSLTLLITSTMYPFFVKQHMYEYDEINERIEKQIKDKYNIETSNFLDEKYKSNELEKYREHALIFLSLIIFVILAGLLIIFYFIVGRHIKELIKVNKLSSEESVVLYQADKIPNSELGQVIRERNKMLTLLVERHNETIRSKAIIELSKIINKISHEVLNPLTISMGTCEMLRDQLKDHSSNQQFNFVNDGLKTIETNSEKIELLIKELHSFLSETDAYKKEPHNIVNIINTILDSTFTNFKKTGDINFLYQSSEYVTNCKVHQFKKALSKLIERSVKISEECPCPKKWVNIELFEDDGNIIIHISDCSSGSPDEKLTDHFSSDELSTNDSTTKIDSGILFANAIIENNGGTIELKNINQHTTTVVTIPRAT